MDYFVFLNEGSLALVASIYALGVMLKGVKKIPDWIIPFALLAFSLGFCFFIYGFTADTGIQAILVTAVAVYSNQTIKQVKEGFSKEEDIK